MKQALLGLLVGLAVGAGGFYLLSPPDTGLPGEDLEAYVAIDDAEPDKPADTRAELEEIDADIDDHTCEETLAMVRQAHADAIRRYSENEELVEHLSDMVDRTALDRPLRFPEFLDDEYQPEGVQAAVDTLMEECPSIFSQDTTVDCSEYPCFIETPFEHTVQNYDFRSECPVITDLLGVGATTFQIPVGDEHRLIYAPLGEGIGLNGFLSENEARHRVRFRLRGEERRRELAHEHFEEPCLVEGDALACRRLAAAYRGHPDEHLFYLQAGCDADDSNACRLFGYHSCVTHGRCTPEAEAAARRALALDPGNASAQGTLAPLVCQGGNAAEANTLYQQACAGGHDASCNRSC